MNGKERREFPRIDAQIKITSSSYIGETRNLSKGGVCFTLKNAFLPGDYKEILIELPRDVKPIKAVVKVIWLSESDVNKGYYDTGVKFVQISEFDRGRLASYLVEQERK